MARVASLNHGPAQSQSLAASVAGKGQDSALCPVGSFSYCTLFYSWLVVLRIRSEGLSRKPSTAFSRI